MAEQSRWYPGRRVTTSRGLTRLVKTRTKMITKSPESHTIPGISPGISALVKEEAARWREAASANQWRVLDPPPARPAADHGAAALRSAHATQRRPRARAS